jgi:SAM-dependent methyltransferase
MNKLLDLLVCPTCRITGRELGLVSSADESTLSCPECKSEYAAMAPNAFRVIKRDIGETKATVQAFWGDLYRQLYSGTESLTPEQLDVQLASLKEYFGVQRMLAVTEVNLDQLAGKVVLEIGSGSGAHSALFRAHGARVIAMDITPERVISSQRMLNNVKAQADYLCLNADGENIPIRSNAIDLVYSNGVLHHSPETDRCIGEVHRVLQPGGSSALMLYCRSSALYFTLLLWRGLFSPAYYKLREEEWLGGITEGRPLHQEAFNPVTRVYDRGQLRSLLHQFDIVSLRKNSFDVGHFLPRGMGLLNRILQKLTGKRKHPGGFLVYGEDGVLQSGVERWFAPYLGFDWNILVKKGTARAAPNN